MADVITMLALSPTMEEGTIAEWLKKEGDEIEEGEVIAEVETDKATMEMESFFDGTLLKVLVKSGDTVKVGAPMAVIGASGEDADAALASFGGGTAPVAEAAPAGEPEPVSEPEPDAPVAPASGSSANGGRIKASPLARRMAHEQGIDLATLAGRGPNGRLVQQDVEDAQAGAKAPSAAASAPAPQAPAGEPVVVGAMPDASGEGRPMSQMRKTIAKRLTQVWQATPHFYLTMEVDMAAAMALRKQVNAALSEAEFGKKISVNDMIIKASAIALERYPRMNVAYAGQELMYFERVHVGVAVAIEDGLITPTVFDANQKSVTRIATEVRELAGKAREKKLKPGEYGGSTFSLSNLGMYGIDHFQAVINPPEAAILAVGAVQQLPVVVDGALAVGTRMKMTLSCDHRAVDGAVGAEFLRELKGLLEHPMLLMA
ncbi:MAG: pyruvate dehydrogenase complex dihydrolipoamide acetyltransferase [Myxococcota bacterium]